MQMFLRQVFIAILGGVVAIGVMLAVNHAKPGPNIALAQTSTSVVTVGSPDAIASPDADAKKAINYQGQVFNPNTGAPYVNSSLFMTFRFYNNSTGTNQVYSEDRNIQTNADGFFSTNIGDATNFSVNGGDLYDIFNGQELYFRVIIGGQELGPLQPISFVPYAFWSVHAHHLDNYDADDFPKIVAHGVVNADGSKRSGDRFNSSRGDVAGSIVYIIEVEGISHTIDEFTTIVTPACDAPIITGVGTTTVNNRGLLVVDIFDPNGGRTTCRFEFMVLEK